MQGAKTVDRPGGVNHNAGVQLKWVTREFPLAHIPHLLDQECFLVLAAVFLCRDESERDRPRMQETEGREKGSEGTLPSAVKQ